MRRSPNAHWTPFSFFVFCFFLSNIPADNQWVFWALVEFCSSSARSQHPRLLYFTRTRESHVSTGILRTWYCTQFSVQESLCLTLASSIYTFKASVFQIYNISCYGAATVENSYGGGVNKSPESQRHGCPIFLNYSLIATKLNALFAGLKYFEAFPLQLFQWSLPTCRRRGSQRTGGSFGCSLSLYLYFLSTIRQAPL